MSLVTWHEADRAGSQGVTGVGWVVFTRLTKTQFLHQGRACGHSAKCPEDTTASRCLPGACGCPSCLRLQPEWGLCVHTHKCLRRPHSCRGLFAAGRAPSPQGPPLCHLATSKLSCKSSGTVSEPLTCTGPFQCPTQSVPMVTALRKIYRKCSNCDQPGLLPLSPNLASVLSL